MLERLKRLVKKEERPIGDLELRKRAILSLMADVQKEINEIHINLESSNEEQMSVDGLRLDSLEKSYFILFNKLRALHELPTFEDVVSKLKDAPNYKEIAKKYNLDSIGDNVKFGNDYDYNSSYIATFKGE